MPIRPLTLLVYAQLVHASPSPLTNCNCTSEAAELLSLPSPAAPGNATPVRITPASDPSLCWSLNKSVGGVTCDGACVYLAPCGADSPTWRWADSGNAALQWLRVASHV